MLKKASSFTAFLLVMFLPAVSFCSAQGHIRQSNVENLATKRLEDVHIEAQSIGQVLAEFALTYDIPLGVEIASYDDELATYRIDFARGTLSEFLTQFVNEHDQYTWKITDGVVNVLPKDNHRDAVLEEMLRTEISGLTIKEKTTCWSLENSLANTAEIKKLLDARGVTVGKANFSGAYFPQLGGRFTLQVSKMALGSILNEVVKESPVAKFWLVKKYSASRTVRIRCSARYEDPPLTNVTPAYLR